MTPTPSLLTWAMLTWVLLLSSAMLIAPVDGIMCSICDLEQMDDCMTKPPVPENCTKCLKRENDDCAQFMRFEHCLIITKYDENDTLIGFIRACSPVGGAASCMTGIDDKRAGSVVKMCNTYCTTDGCNTASQSQPFTSIAMVTFISLSILLNKLRISFQS